MPTDKLRGVQALRFAAAMLIVIHHIALNYVVRGGTALPLDYFAASGYIGVDIFFVISGFVIHRSGASLCGASAAALFAYRRAVRIFVPYWPIALGTWLMMYFGQSPAHVSRIDFWPSMFLLPIEIRSLILSVTWTLSYELLFYAVFALTVINPAYRGPILGAFLAVVAAAVLGQSMGGDLGPIGNALANPLIFDFFIGIGVSLLIDRLRPARYWGPVFLLTVAGFVAAGLAIQSGLMSRVSPLRVPVVGGLAALLVLSVTGLERTRSLPLMWSKLGDASYALYLLHVPLLWLLWEILPFRQIDYFRQHPTIGAVVILLGSVLASVAYHRYVEQPLLWALNPARWRRSTTVAATGG